MIKTIALKAIGAAVSSPLFIKLLWKVARPHVHLKDANGSLYMGRWSIIDEFHRVDDQDTTKRTLSSRILQALTGYASIRLHHIARADRGRELHNHPFPYRTFILNGWYIEELEKSYRVSGKGDTATGDQHTFHRIAMVPLLGVDTLFFMGPNTGLWGFDMSGKFVDSATYKQTMGGK